MTKDEALKLALEALETLMLERGSIYDKAITAIKQALAAPVQGLLGGRRRTGAFLVTITSPTLHNHTKKKRTTSRSTPPHPQHSVHGLG